MCDSFDALRVPRAVVFVARWFVGRDYASDIVMDLVHGRRIAHQPPKAMHNGKQEQSGQMADTALLWPESGLDYVSRFPCFSPRDAISISSACSSCKKSPVRVASLNVYNHSAQHRSCIAMY